MTSPDIIPEIIETLKQVTDFASIPILAEDKGNVYTELDQKIASTNIAIVVAMTGFTPSAEGTDELVGKTSYTISVFENPTTHRDTPGVMGAMAIARLIALTLTGAAAEGMADKMHLKNIASPMQLDNNVISVDIEFSTTTNL